MEKDTEKEIVQHFVNYLEALMLGIQQVDNSCMESYKDVTKREFSLLATLGRSRPLIMREVADFLKVPLSTATGIIDKLIQKGYIVRDFSPEDRRVIQIHLSEEGKSIFASLHHKLSCHCSKILEEFTPEEKRQFVGYLQKATGSLETVSTE